jgi:coenzyme PQQ precursor peptide PqqA
MAGKSQPKPPKKWSKPTAKDIRLGFELTAYVLKR